MESCCLCLETFNQKWQLATFGCCTATVCRDCVPKIETTTNGPLCPGCRTVIRMPHISPDEWRRLAGLLSKERDDAVAMVNRLINNHQGMIDLVESYKAQIIQSDRTILLMQIITTAILMIILYGNMMGKLFLPHV